MLEIELALDIEYYHITTSVSHLTCPLPPHQSVIWLAHCHHISQPFDLPTATTSSVRAGTSARDRASARHRALPYHCISQSFDLPPATTSVSHFTCPLPPHQSVIWLALYHCITALPRRSVIWLAPTTTSVSHLTCPLPPHQAVIWLAHCHHIIMSPPPLALALALALALGLTLVLALAPALVLGN